MLTCKSKFIFSLFTILINLFLSFRKAFAEEEVEISNPIKAKTPTDLFSQLISFVLGFVGALAVVMLIYGGFTYITSAGDEQKAKSAKGIITYSIIGLILVLCSWVIIKVVTQALGVVE